MGMNWIKRGRTHGRILLALMHERLLREEVDHDEFDHSAV